MKCTCKMCRDCLNEIQQQSFVPKKRTPLSIVGGYADFGDRVQMRSTNECPILISYDEKSDTTVVAHDAGYTETVPRIDLRWLQPSLPAQVSEAANPQTGSKRYNSGKPQTSEIDPAFIIGIAEVLTKSREKYERANWALGNNWSVPYESMMRHLMAFQAGEEIDSESGKHHLLHAATNIMFLYYYTQTFPEFDDRIFKGKKK
jgi:hypothetical protein